VKKYVESTFRSRICMKYIDSAVVRLKNKRAVNESDLSLVERILDKETDPKMAYIFALDLILVGIDTASFSVKSSKHRCRDWSTDSLLEVIPEYFSCYFSSLLFSACCSRCCCIIFFIVFVYFICSILPRFKINIDYVYYRYQWRCARYCINWRLDQKNKKRYTRN